PSAGQITLMVDGQPGLTYVIESSTNLLNWFPVSTNRPAIGGNINISLPGLENDPQRYFRARAL
ncbi:MAG: hypothetical protein SFY81_13605, partial [Verrucomicrobiota bacterium]|nr:hypothetical protein [Verrucomicrobiota bacterium]